MQRSLRTGRQKYILLCCAMLPGHLSAQDAAGLPAGFVHADVVIEDLVVDLRYFTADNFVGERIDGYERPRCILTEPAARALRAARDELRPQGLGLKVFDCYRPQRAVDHFARWAREPDSGATKAAFYPNVDKSELFAQGYIAARSSHSRGSAVDVTLITMPPEAAASSGGNAEPDVGTPFDFFDRASWPDYRGVSPRQRANRLLLRLVMEKHGFAPYPQEWWHFRLKDEPFPSTYFDFPVR